MNIPNNPYAGKSRAELERQADLIRLQMQELEAQEAREREALQSRENIVAAVALKWALGLLKDRNKLGKAFDDIIVQQLPREGLLGKAAGLDGDTIEAIKEAAQKAIESAVKG